MKLKSYDRIWLPVGILLSISFAIFCGFIFGERMKALAWVGTLFLNLLKMVIVPMIFSSIVTGIGRLGDVRKIGRVGLITIFFYLVTMGIAVSIGMILSNLNPSGVNSVRLAENGSRVNVKEATVTDIIIELVPPNIFEAMSAGRILPLIFFAMFFGGILSTMGDRARHLRSFFEITEEIMMKMVEMILRIAPIGIFGLVAGRLGEAGGGEAFLVELFGLRVYAVNVIGGLLIQSLVVLPLLLILIARRNPIPYTKNMFLPLATAFSTASSSATLPLTMDSSIRLNGISKESAGFVLPLGATVNMDGTALYEAAAAMFIAQTYGVEMGTGDQIVIFLTATFAAIGAAGIPEAGLITMVMVLEAVHLPVEGIAILLTIDWFLDRCRTTVNVWGDAVVAAIIDRIRGVRTST
jgi:Na+/H+-dicarboxylate symporter